MRPRAERSWTDGGKGHRGNFGTSKDSPMCRKMSETASKKSCNGSCRMLSRGGMIFYQSIRVCKKRPQDTEYSGQEEEHAKEDCGCSVGDAEDQR